MKTRIFLTCALLVFISLSSKIVAQSLAIPTLASPANGSGSNPPNALLDWTASSGQTAYEFRIGLSNNLIQPLLSQLLQAKPHYLICFLAHCIIGK